MSLARCSHCHLPITDVELQNGACSCGAALVVHHASAAPIVEQKAPEYSPTLFNLALVAGIVIFLAALSFGIWTMSKRYDIDPDAAATVTRSK